MYIAGRFRTASRPSRTVIESALYSVFDALANSNNLYCDPVKIFLKPAQSVLKADRRLLRKARKFHLVLRRICRFLDELKRRGAGAKFSGCFNRKLYHFSTGFNRCESQ